jgi:malate dehydrogenase (oxaloacetate-decarboxylating)(NADP+)
MVRRDDALRYHSDGRPGKLEVRASKPSQTPRSMRLAYIPGATAAAEEILGDPREVYRLTSKANLVGVVTNGSAVPGLGDVGPEAAKPVQEGIALILKRLADIDVFDLEIDAREPRAMIDTIARVAPTFGAINLKDVRAPEGLEVYDELRECVPIPIFHENLYGLATVAIAALINALELANKSIADARVVVAGAETVGIGCARLLRRLGVGARRMLVYDVEGLLTPERDDLHPYQREFAVEADERTLAEGVRGADVFVGASAGGILAPEMLASMAASPIVLAMASPAPEIEVDAARAVRDDVLVATSRAEAPNALEDLLSFPFILRGALDVRAASITESMLLSAARALAELAREPVVDEVSRAHPNETLSFGPSYLLPKSIDPRVFERVSAAVARCAVEEGVAHEEFDPSAYREGLFARRGSGRDVLRRIMLQAGVVERRVVLPDAGEERVLRAARVMIEEGMARPVLVGDEAAVAASAERLGIDLSAAEVLDPTTAPRRERYVERYHEQRHRRGVTREVAERRLRDAEVFAAMVVDAGDADVLVAGARGFYTESLRVVDDVVGVADGVTRIASHHLVLGPQRTLFVADCAVQRDPSPEELADTAILTARAVRELGLEPRVALLASSNFGSVEHAAAARVRAALRIVEEREPGLSVDGEMQLSTALDAELRERFYPFSTLGGPANVLVFPDQLSGHLALDAMRNFGETLVVGPVLMGTRRPAQVVSFGAGVDDFVHLAAVGIVEASGRQAGPRAGGL